MDRYDELPVLTPSGLQHYLCLQTEAASVLTNRFYATYSSLYERFGDRGLDVCREDFAFHLEFLRPVLEFGFLQPMVDYLHWIGNVLAGRGIPAGYMAQTLDWLAEYFARAMEPGDSQVVVAALTATRTKFTESCNEPQISPVSPEPWPQATVFEAALLAGDQVDALGVVNDCLDAGHGLVAIELHLIQPALYSIGEKWQTNQVSVAQEHMATAIAQSVMTVALLRSPPPSPMDRRVLLACVEGNDHSVGLRMVADSFLLSGWDVQYLGANVPTRSLVQQVVDWRPDLLALSVSFPQHLSAVKAVIAALTQCLGATRPAIMVGGLAINRFRPLADVVGADASATNALAAVELASHIVGHQASQ